MTSTSERQPCPYCGEMILTTAKKCKYCKEYLDPELEARETGPSGVEKLLVPIGRAPSAIAAGYMALLSCFPLIGFFFAILAIAFGFMALNRIKKKPKEGGKGRAIFGIILGGLMLLLQGGLGIVAIIAALQKK